MSLEHYGVISHDIKKTHGQLPLSMSLIVYSNTGYLSDTIMSIVLHIAMPITPSWSFFVD